MKRFEKDLRMIIKLCEKNGGSIESDALESQDSVDFLRALGLIDTECETFDSCEIQVTDSGMTYFYEKSEKRKASVRNWSMNIVIAIISSIFGAALARLSMLLFP